MVRFVIVTVLQAALVWGCSQTGSTESSAVTDTSTTTATAVTPPAPKVDETTGQPIEEPSEETFLITYPTEFINAAAFEATWKASPKAVDYDAIIAPDSQCKVPLQAYGDITVLKQQTTALPEGTYYFCVYAIQEKGKLLEAANSPLTFTIDLTPPTAPVLSDVSANGFTNNNTPVINWTAATGHDYYDLKIISGIDCETSVQSYADLDGTLTSKGVMTALADGIYSLCLNARDKAGNVAEASNNQLGFTVDTVKPRVTSITASTADGMYKAGDAVTLVLTFSEIVNVDTAGGTPSLMLETGATDTEATYASGSGTDTLTFTYTVVAGDNSTDLDAVAGSGQIVLNGGTIQDRALNDAELTVPVAAESGSLASNQAIVIDTTAPTVTAVTSPNANGYYKLGDVIDITVTFAEPVTVANGASMAIRLENGATDRDAIYQSGTGTDTLMFRYQIQNNDMSNDLATNATNVITLNGATLTDLVGNNAVLTLPTTPAAATLAGSKAIIADGRAPTISQITSSTANGSYNAGDVISVRVVFAETVSVTNGAGMTLTLETGATDALATYASGSGSTTLVFSYTVASGHTSADLAVHADGITLNGATVNDLAGNAAPLTLPAAGSSLAALKNLVIDTSAPYVTGVSASSADGSYKVGDTVTLTVTFNENAYVTNGASVKLALDTGAEAVYSAGSASNTLSFTYTVGSGEASADLNATALTIVPTGIIRDLAQNDADLNLPVTQLSDVKDIVVDGVAPGAFTITGPSAMTYASSQTAAWNASTDATAYDVTVSTANDCASPVHAAGSPYVDVGATSQGLNLVDGVYYLCVTAKDAVGNTLAASNQPWAFEVESSIVHVSYTTFNAGTHALKHGKWTAGAATLTTVEADGVNEIVARSSLALDSAEKVHVSYAKGSGGDYEWRYAQNTAGAFADELAEAGVNPGDSVGLTPSVALASNDTVRMVADYAFNDGVTPDQRLAEVGGTTGAFSTTVIQTEAAGHVFQDQSLAIDGSNVAHLLHVHQDGMTYNLRYRNDSGGGWGFGADESLSGGGCSKYLYASIALSSTNKVHGATLCVTAAGECRVHHVTNASGSWVHTQVGVVDSAGCSELTMTERDRPTIVLDASDKAHVVYFDEENAKLMYATDVSGSFTSSMISLGSGWQPTIARDAAGKLYVFYLTTASGVADLKLLSNNSGSWSAVDIDATGTVIGIGDAAVAGVKGRSNR